MSLPHVMRSGYGFSTDGADFADGSLPPEILSSLGWHPLLGAIRDLNEKTAALLEQSRVFADLLDDTRLAMEVGAIQALAERLVARLRTADPLAGKVHEGKLGFALAGAQGALGALLRRAFRPRRKTANATQ